MAGRGLGLLSRKDVSAHLVDHLRALGEAVELCEGRVDPEALAEARRVVDQADRRLAMSGSATVVALAGATGSGKSSTFNALSGTTLATVGVRRPTTAHAMAAAGARNRPRSCWTGSRSRDGTRWRPILLRMRPWTGWCCWTCLIMTPPSWTIAWRSTGWCSWWTC